VGKLLGTGVGFTVGVSEGELDGNAVGIIVGKNVGVDEGITVGLVVGNEVGAIEYPGHVPQDIGQDSCISALVCKLG
jgi:hypothetical protein